MVKEELYIGGQRVELLESLNPNLTFNIADIAKPDTRKADFSKTITLPGSKTINKIFEHSFEVNLALQTFNPNLKTSVVYLVDGEINIDGYLQLKQINITDTDDVIYEVTITGRLGDFITDVGGSLLTDLDMSGLDHVYNKANQLATWVNPIDPSKNYVYPMINYDINYGTFQQGFTEDWYVEDFYPAITVWKYLNEIFKAVDYTYTSAFIDSAFFKTLIVPYGSKDFKITEAGINARIFKANTPYFSSTSSDTLTFANSSGADTYNVDPSIVGASYPQLETTYNTAENYDTSNVHNTTTGVYTVNLDGAYNIIASYIFQGIMTVPASMPSFSGDFYNATTIYGLLQLNHYDSGGSFIATLDEVEVGIANDQTTALTLGSTYTTAASPTFGDLHYSTNGMQSGIYGYAGVWIYWAYNTNNNNPCNQYTVQASNVNLLQNEQIKVEIKVGLYSRIMNSFNAPNYSDVALDTSTPYLGTEEHSGGEYKLKILSGYFKNTVVNNNLVEGLTIDMNAPVPEKVKQKDFFMSIVKMFNLYVQTDASNERNLIIEPREDFYLDGSANIVDWTQKLDYNQALELLPMGATDNKDYMYKYKEDKDYYNLLYTDTWNRSYGDYLYNEFDNDFLKNEFTTDVIFSPTPSVGQWWYDRVIPTIIKTDKNGQAQRTESNIRILQWGGLKSTGQQWRHVDQSGGTTKTDYPFSGMYNDPYTPTIDIGFSLTREIYWDDNQVSGQITLTDNNLFNKYYKKMIDEITDKDSKIVRGWFYLQPTDIRDLSFRKIFRFENAYFRLNKIENYNPNNPLTKCEFLKLKDVDTFTPTTAIAVGGVGLIAGLELPLFATGGGSKKNGNSLGNLNISVSGQNNYVSKSAKNIMIVGDNNKVFSNCSNMIIRGNRNVVKANTENVSLLNTDDTTISLSGSVYINNTREGGGSLLNINASVDAEESVTTYLGDTSGGNVVLTLLATPTIGKTWIAKKTDAANTFQLRVSGGGTIDGSATKNLTSLNESVTVQFDGTNYIII